MRHQELPPDEITTVNVVRPERLAVLRNDMKKHGWRDERALLVEEVTPRWALPGYFEYYAWTGSHRLEAARAAGLRVVPCLVIEMSDSDAFVAAGFPKDRNGYTTWRECVGDNTNDTGRLKALEKTGLHQAIELQRIEVRVGGGQRFDE